MIVLDASAAVELVVGTALGREIADRVADPDSSLHVPHLLSVEVTQVLRRFVLAGTLSPGVANLALSDLVDLDVVLHRHEPLLPRVWELRDNLTAYDATYVALAELLDAPLLTLDGRLARSPGHTATIELVTHR